jgi:hypothetical protein
MEQPSNNKARIITACVIIAAVAIIYFVTTGRAKTGDAASSQTSDTAITTPSQSSTDNSSSTSASSSSPSYKDGTYSAAGSYRTPETLENINVTLTVKDGVVTDSSVQQTPQDRESVQYQADFKNNYKNFVIGKKLSDINLSRVSGSSLTSSGFNTAVDKIKSEAAS